MKSETHPWISHFKGLESVLIKGEGESMHDPYKTKGECIREQQMAN